MLVICGLDCAQEKQECQHCGRTFRPDRLEVHLLGCAHRPQEDAQLPEVLDQIHGGTSGLLTLRQAACHSNLPLNRTFPHSAMGHSDRGMPTTGH